MRPTDEHQSPSTRPNFMSSARRPAGSPDNILARLELGRAPRRRLWPTGKIAGTAAGALALLGLAWLLAGMAQDSLQVHQAREVVVTAVAPTVAAAPTSSVQAEQEALLEPRAPVQFDPVAVDADATLVEPTLTPLPLLAEVVEAPASAAGPAKAARRAPRPTAAAKSAAPKVARAPVPRPAATGRIGAAEAALENDVALLSAILINTPRHSAERARAEAACNNDKKCQSGAAASLLKTTD